MVNFIIVIAVIGLFIVLLATIIKYFSFKKYLLHGFKDGNVITFGRKRRGKDLVHQYVINQRKDFYYGNISYGGKHKIVKLKDISCEPNTYDNFINDNIVKTPHLFKEGKDFYISDIGNFLPSQMDSQLHKKFPSMPIFYSLSGQLYGSNIHCNSQSVERGWKALREQADFYVWAHRTLKIFGLIFITVLTTYEKYSSAREGLMPMKKRLFNKFSKAEYDKFVATNGVIRNGYIIQFKHNLKYDTRAFEKVLLKGRRKK